MSQANHQGLSSVVVTGMGVISPLGHEPDQMFERLCHGESGIRAIEHFDVSYSPSKIGGVVEGFNIRDHINDRATLRNARLLEATQQWGLSAARQAMTDAGLEDALLDEAARADSPVSPDRIGVCLGTGLAGRSQVEVIGRSMIQTYNREILKAVQQGQELEEILHAAPEELMQLVGRHMVQEINPIALLQQCPSIITAYVGMRYGARGPNFTLVSLCAAGAQAIGEAAWMIARGDADCMIAGGVDSMLNPMDLAAFARMDAVSARNDEAEAASKPFDIRRDGCVVGEGAATLVLESEESARRRGAKILARLIGYGTTDDAYKVSAPPEDGGGAQLAMNRAIERANLKAMDIDHINAHGTSTPLNDRIETYAIKQVLGEHARQIPVVSTKSMTGHLIAAAGALEAVITIQSLRYGKVPPTINLLKPDPRCDLDYVTEGARAMPDMRRALSNSFAVGGVNASLIFEREAA